MDSLKALYKIVVRKNKKKELYRIRQGSYRIVYSIQEKGLTVWIVKIEHKKERYKKINE